MAASLLFPQPPAVLNGPSGSDPKARVSYAAMWQDGIGRQTAAANYGTNGNTPITRPTSAPSSSSTVLVSQVAYNIRGEAYQSTDPMGTVMQTTLDNAGRRTVLVENYISGGTDPDQNRTTLWSYNADSNVTTITAYNSTTGNQTTEFFISGVRGLSPFRSPRRKRGLSPSYVRAKSPATTSSTSPPTPTAAPSSTNTTATGDRIQTTDQNATIHQFAFDKLGRQTLDQVAALGAGLDAAVVAVGAAYNVLNQLTTVSVLADSSINSVVNQVQRSYNGFQQLTAESQEHGGAVNSSTPQTGYLYADGSANTIRPVALTYPNGTNTLGYAYDDPNGIDSNLSRITSLGLKQAKPARGFGGRSQRVPGAEQRSAVVEPCGLSLLHRSMFPFWVGRRGGTGASGLRLQGRLSAT